MRANQTKSIKQSKKSSGKNQLEKKAKHIHTYKSKYRDYQTYIISIKKNKQI